MPIMTAKLKPQMNAWLLTAKIVPQFGALDLF